MKLKTKIATTQYWKLQTQSRPTVIHYWYAKMTDFSSRGFSSLVDYFVAFFIKKKVIN